MPVLGASWRGLRVRVRSERDLADHYQMSYGTVRRATKLLRDRGRIETIHGRGTYIRQT